MEDQDLFVLIARTCHEANRAYCRAHGDFSHESWANAPDWQKQSALDGVKFHCSGDHGPEASHNNWMEQKVKDGWVYGATKNEVHKTHPCIRPYGELPVEQQTKDAIFIAIVHSMRDDERLKSALDMREYSDARTGFAEPESQ